MRQFIFTIALLALCACTMWPVQGVWSNYIRDTRTKRAESGDINAMWELGKSYCCGPKDGFYDTTKAIHWWCRAAKMGDAKSQVELGKIYQNSYKSETPAVLTNDAKAYMWYSVAEKYGNREAAVLRQSLEGHMTENNLTKAIGLLPKWQQTNCEAWEEAKGPWDEKWVDEQQKKEREEFKEIERERKFNFNRDNQSESFILKDRRR